MKRFLLLVIVAGTSLKLLRVSDDGETTTGLLFVNDRFYCYTLEDTGQKTGQLSESRIPAGTYPLTMNTSARDELTNTYRDLFPEWFSDHLQLNNIPGYPSVYIHHGGNHGDCSSGCILVSDSIRTQTQQTALINSLTTYQRLYQFIAQQLAGGKAHRITIHDESWIKKLNPES